MWEAFSPPLVSKNADVIELADDDAKLYLSKSRFDGGHQPRAVVDGGGIDRRHSGGALSH
jgi:hypothetical protein